MFAARVNCVTGKVEWVVTGKDMDSVDTDLSEEFSRSQYGDMLHDTERNKKYDLGLKWAISDLLSQGLEPRVLDIGSGTGLLSMMAARNGARNVTAIEVLKPMVRILKSAVKDNGHEEVIRVIPKHSTDVKVGPDGDIPQRANILVTEVFDSELIGEGAVPTFRHAHRELLEKGALVIPSEGKVYVQLVQSEFLWHSHSLDPTQLPAGVSINIPRPWNECLGPASLWDVHLEEVIGSYDVTPLSEPHLVATFSFSEPSLPVYKEHSPVSIPVTKSGSCNAIAVWWTITLAPEVELSMSPWQPNLQWRDHWLPCVQVLPRPLAMEKESSVKLQAINDEYTLWTAIMDDSKSDLANGVVDHKRPVCSCGVHLAWSRSRLRAMNDRRRNNQFMAALDKILPHVSSVLCIGDGSLLPILCSQRGPPTSLRKIYSVESNTHSFKSVNELIKDARLPIPVQFLNKSPTELDLSDVGGSPVNALIAEPFFITTTLPWHNLYYWYVRSSLASDLLAPNAVIMPCSAVLKAIAVKFKDLHLLKAAVGTVEGFDISAYDRAVANALQRPLGEALDPEDFALWEYPCYPLSRVQTLMNFDFTEPVPAQEVKSQGRFPLTVPSTECHGIVMWMEYQLTPQDTELLSEGLLEPPSEGAKLKWSSGHNQAVCFFMDYEKTEIQYSAVFDTSVGEISFRFYS